MSTQNRKQEKTGIVIAYKIISHILICERTHVTNVYITLPLTNAIVFLLTRLLSDSHAMGAGGSGGEGNGMNTVSNDCYTYIMNAQIYQSVLLTVCFM